MSCPTKLCFENYGFDGNNLSHFKDLDVGDDFSPVDVLNGMLSVCMVYTTNTKCYKRMFTKRTTAYNSFLETISLLYQRQDKRIIALLR